MASGGQDAGSENTRRPGTRVVYTRRILGLLRIPFPQRWLCQLRKPHRLAPSWPGVTRCARVLGAGPPLHPATCRRGGAQPAGYTPPSLPGSPLQVLDVMGSPPPQPRLTPPLCNSGPSLGRGPEVLGGQAVPGARRTWQWTTPGPPSCRDTQRVVGADFDLTGRSLWYSLRSPSVTRPVASFTRHLFFLGGDCQDLAEPFGYFLAHPGHTSWAGQLCQRPAGSWAAPVPAVGWPGAWAPPGDAQEGASLRHTCVQLAAGPLPSWRRCQRS